MSNFNKHFKTHFKSNPSPIKLPKLKNSSLLTFLSPQLNSQKSTNKENSINTNNIESSSALLTNNSITSSEETSEASILEVSFGECLTDLSSDVLLGDANSPCSSDPFLVNTGITEEGALEKVSNSIQPPKNQSRQVRRISKRDLTFNCGQQKVTDFLQTYKKVQSTISELPYLKKQFENAIQSITDTQKDTTSFLNVLKKTSLKNSKSTSKKSNRFSEQLKKFLFISVFDWRQFIVRNVICKYAKFFTINLNPI